MVFKNILKLHSFPKIAEDHTKMNHKGFRCEDTDWIHLAQVRNKWWAQA
jgi:hypothetical protein